jgi:hypothetical protein
VAGSETGFSVVGTLFIALAYVLLLLPGAVALAVSSRRWAWAVVGAGVAVLVSQGLSIGLQEVDGTLDLGPGRWALLLLVLAAMAAVAVGQAVLVARTARRPRSSSGPGAPPRVDRCAGHAAASGGSLWCSVVVFVVLVATGTPTGEPVPGMWPVTPPASRSRR